MAKLFKKNTTLIALLVSLPVLAHQHTHLDDKVQGKPATVATQNANKALAETLNWQDRVAFERNQQGLIVPLDGTTSAIMLDDYGFIDQKQLSDTVNPSLYRQAQLNNTAAGLYQVSEGIYQVRGTDLSNITFIRGKTGWIAYDVLLTKEAAHASTEFFLKHVPNGKELPVVAMIYSHSHADHFGGARAIKELFPDVKVYGPHNMTKEVVDENVLAGNAMSRRSAFQYGATLGAHEQGIVDAGLGKGISKGEITYQVPDYTFNRDSKFETYEVDGLEMIFIDTRGTEAPAGMATYIPSKKALWTGEMMYHGMHNAYTLRGAKVRDALKWSKDINEMINAWGDDVEILFGSHSSPIWGNEQVVDYMQLQRDNYGFVHNQTLRLANQGVVLQDIGDAVSAIVPSSIEKAWHTNGYHGSYSHNAKAVYNMYLGYFDMNPANLNPLPREAEAKKFVDYMGGSQAILKRAKRDFEQGEYRFVATALDKLVRAEPNNKAARKLLADTYEQLGYQAETMGWRNTYLTGAQELRIGTQPGTPKTASIDVVSQMSVTNLFDFLAVQVDASKAQYSDLSFNLVVTDKQETHYIELKNGNLNNGVVSKTRDADASITLTHQSLMAVVLGVTNVNELITSGAITISGDKQVIAKLKNSLVEFDSSFEVVPRPQTGLEVDSHLYQ